MDGDGQELVEKNFLTRDRRIRRRILDIYNKEEEDFKTKAEWDLYLEELEDIIFNLVEGIDVEQTDRKVKEYQKLNIESIEACRARRTRREQDAAQAAAGPDADVEVVEAYDVPADEAMAPAAPAYGAKAAYMPSGMAAAAGMAPVAPVPLVWVEMDAEGRLPARRAGSKEAYWKMAAASGWSKSITDTRALHDAFTSIFVS